MERSFYCTLKLGISWRFSRAVYYDMYTQKHITRRGGMAWRVSVSPVKEKAIAQGIKNPRQLALRAHINKRTARRWWNDDPEMLYIDKPTLLALSICLECEPGDLITKIEMMD